MKAETKTSKKEEVKIKDVRETNASRRLYRSETDRVLGGVAGGIANFFDVDSTLVRLIFVLVILLGGSGVLVYIILWIVIPSESSKGIISEETMKSNAKEIENRAKKFTENLGGSGSVQNSRFVFGLIVIGIGIFFLLTNLNIIREIDFDKFWPLILVAIGVAILAKNN